MTRAFVDPDEPWLRAMIEGAVERGKVTVRNDVRTILTAYFTGGLDAETALEEIEEAVSG